MREDLRELLDVARGEVLGLLPVAIAQARDDLGAQQVDLPVQDAAPEGDLALALRALVNALAQLVVGQVPGVAGIVARPAADRRRPAPSAPPAPA